MTKTQVTGAQIGPLDLTVEVTGILPVANGGTGGASLSAAGIVDLSSIQTLINKTLTDPKINQILDTNGNVSLGLDATASAVNSLRFYNAPAGSAVGFYGAGTDTDVFVDIAGKGAGKVRVGGSEIATIAGTQTLTNKTITGVSGTLTPCQVMTTGTETFTIASGSVTQIAGTTVQTYSPAIGDRILITNAPASTGTGSSFGHSTQPGNGIYTVTANTTNLTLSRAVDMSGTVYPAGLSTFVERGASWLSAVQMIVTTPLGTGTGVHTWGTNTVQWAPNGGLAPTFNGLITAGSGVASNSHIYPMTTNAYDLGTSGAVWRHTYTADVILPGTASAAYAQGKLVYDTDNECLTFFNNDSNVSMNIGQETWLRVRNVTGSTIANGAAVYVNGTDTGMGSVALAKGDVWNTSVSLGLATEAIANNTAGWVCVSGEVRGLNTSAYTAGALVYVSSATAGALTATAPIWPNYQQVVGRVTVSNASTGRIHVIQTQPIPGPLGPTTISAPGATPTVNWTIYNDITYTTLAAAITSMTTGLTAGTPTHGQKLMLGFKDNGTARAIAWGASYVSSGVATLLATTVVNKMHLVGLRYDSTVAKWVCISVDATGY